MLRLRWQDIDLVAETVTLHERKRDKEKHTTRRVQLSPGIVQVLKDWKEEHPGGPYVFCHALRVAHSKKQRTAVGALTRDEANDHFKRTVAGSKWERLRGWHVFRHSFMSNCAAAGIDQRLLDAWSEQQTEEMRQRYRHLIPDQQRQAIRLVFGAA
jgi:integrase